MRDRKTGRIIWYLFSAVLIKWGVEIAVATFALSCGLRSNMGIGAVSSIITIPMIAWIYRKDQGRYEKQQESWWKYKAASRYGMWLVMIVGAVTACVAMNDIVMLMNMQRISQVYQSTEQIIYSAPRWLQLAGAGILAPVAEGACLPRDDLPADAREPYRCAGGCVCIHFVRCRSWKSATGTLCNGTRTSACLHL